MDPRRRLAVPVTVLHRVPAAVDLEGLVPWPIVHRREDLDGGDEAARLGFPDLYALLLDGDFEGEEQAGSFVNSGKRSKDIYT